MSYVIPPVPYINASSSQTQNATVPPNAAYAITFDTVSHSSGITASSSQITFNTSGKYLLTFSAVCDSSSGAHTLNLWFSKSGTNIESSNTTAYVAASGNPIVCTVNLIEEIIAGQYIQVLMSADSVNAGIYATASSVGPPAIPASPSIILTANKISD